MSGSTVSNLSAGLRKSWWVGIVLAVGLAIVVAAQWPRLALPNVPQVSFNTIDGVPLSSEHLRGRLTLVNFWATTCSVCMQEMPSLIQTYRDFHERGFDVIAVAMPYDRPDWVLAYSRRKQMPFKVAIDFDGKVNRAFGGIESTPTSFLIDAQGRIVSRIVGAPDFGKLRGAIEKALPKVEQVKG